MNNLISCLKPPDIVRGMTKLEKTLFTNIIRVFVMTIKKDVKLSAVLPLMKKYLLKIENFKPIQCNAALTEIYLNPVKIGNWTDISDEDRRQLEMLNITAEDLRCSTKELSYENFSAEDILKSVLPKEKEGMASFTKVGHVVHVNLREHLLPYKSLIGQVLLDKVPGCTSVVNKTNNIDNTYRNFQMEVLAGIDDMLVTAKECGCSFQFDFATVYWNSRLSTEHERIIKLLKPGDILFDVFAGVGPFSIPAAKNKCQVYANDLNPESFKWLNHNAKLNKINEKFLRTFNKDGRAFIQEDVKSNLLKHIKENVKVYITMNLPAMATEFINAFHKLYQKDELNEETSNWPTVYVYCFAKGEEPMQIGRELINRGMGFNLDSKITEIFKVRTVSSFKDMLRIKLTLDDEILVGADNFKRKIAEAENYPRKRNCDGSE